MTDETNKHVHVGLGSLLHEAVDLADRKAKPEIEEVELEDGSTALMVLGHEGDCTKADHIDPSEFDAWRSKPLHREGNPTLTTLDSLIDYTNRYKDADSVVFADDNRERPKLVTVLDYHREGGPETGSQRFGRHTAIFPVPLSDEWKAWNALNGKPLEMPVFARFLEDHIVDVMDPAAVQLGGDQEKFVGALGGKKRMADPAKLMELASGLQVFEEAQVKQAHRIQTGETQLRVENAHKDGEGNDLVVPSMFVIAIPVFKGGEPYQIVVRLRYRKTGAGILFFYELWRDDKVFDHAFNEACEKVIEQTGLSLFRGNR